LQRSPYHVGNELCREQPKSKFLVQPVLRGFIVGDAQATRVRECVVDRSEAQQALELLLVKHSAQHLHEQPHGAEFHYSRGSTV